jgi:hypothetical protein
MPIFRGKITVSSASDYKDSVRVATKSNTNLPSSILSIDGIELQDKDRVLLTGQTSPSQNGIYVWSSTTYKLSRAFDADSSAEVSSGMQVFVEEGILYANTFWTLITPGNIQVGTTPLTFVRDGKVQLFSSAGTYGDDTSTLIIKVDDAGEIEEITQVPIANQLAAGNGISINNYTISIASNVVTVTSNHSFENKTMDGGTF